MGKVLILRVSACPHGGGGGGGRLGWRTSSPIHNTSTGPISFLEGYPSDWSKVPSGGGGKYVPQSQVEEGCSHHTISYGNPPPPPAGKDFGPHLARTGQTNPPPLPPAGQDRRTPRPPAGPEVPLARTGVPPPLETEHQREYFIRGGWYASCVNARGLSCLSINFPCTLSFFLHVQLETIMILFLFGSIYTNRKLNGKVDFFFDFYCCAM